MTMARLWVMAWARPLVVVRSLALASVLLASARQLALALLASTRPMAWARPMVVVRSLALVVSVSALLASVRPLAVRPMALLVVTLVQLSPLVRPLAALLVPVQLPVA